MQEALALAEQGRGRTSPNPAVGAVVVRDGAIVGRGFHTWSGVEHAETLALKQAGAAARGSTLYVTLEPCSHQGRTAPCAEAIVRAGISRVVAAIEDPNPQVRGQGFERLRQAGVEVVVDDAYRAAAERL
ncbi:MAG: bifunctional diaminohydroxyphosphoribosylaminopyrimidine deaminase/5-amino-6-(5-phosphoribosylamino)uracil reductase RibD, partial [Acidobacteriaceae bacterium]|nr:bifunctional diaminohydroxyphosphoribosylaminopyrimidine deaminase/5-amino-6-(5-phosphoribosylamino)uracil reductase RibD [Acidobacteriaceae bacterium]